MGCFSYVCKKCGRGVRSSSFDGEKCHIFAIKDGKVLEKIEGDYNSYGSVFINNTQDESVNHRLRKSKFWSNPTPSIEFSEEELKYHSIEGAGEQRLLDLIMNCAKFEYLNNTGIAIYHDHCYNGEIPRTISERDPNQGWGDKESKSLTDKDGITKYINQVPKENYDSDVHTEIDYLKEHLFHEKSRLISRQAELLLLEIKGLEVKPVKNNVEKTELLIEALKARLIFLESQNKT